MSLPENSLFESALSLPRAERADLAFQLLQTLTPPGDEVPTAEFRSELYDRVEAHRRGEIPSYGLEEARAIIEQRLRDRHA
jgi:putative addiction module component (TIGR02574 family)